MILKTPPDGEAFVNFVCACNLAGSTSNNKRPLTTNDKEDANYDYYVYSHKLI